MGRVLALSLGVSAGLLSSTLILLVAAVLTMFLSDTQRAVSCKRVVVGTTCITGTRAQVTLEIMSISCPE